MKKTPKTSYQCWICNSSHLKLFKKNNINKELSPRLFTITDKNYGVTGELHQCQQCGFIQCVNLKKVLRFYENVKDVLYEKGRKSRALQFKKILKTIQSYLKEGRLFDVGASSGILVEQALAMGFNAVGLEPSKWLQAKAKEKGLPIYLGTLPHVHCRGPYDIVCLIDVIEHVSEPLRLLKNIHKIIAKSGIVVLVTPNVQSLMARLLKWKWWHYRVGHIGYFSQSTLNLATKNIGFKLLGMHSSGWYFNGEYLFERILSYLPKAISISPAIFLKDIIIPLNLGDSILGVYQKQDD